MAVRSKRYLEVAKRVDQVKVYAPREAISLAKETSSTKFDESVELHIRTNLDPRRSDHQLRGIALLPYGLGKKVRILVFAQGPAETIAREAGADHVGGDELIKKIEEGWLDFDVAIATPDIMGKIGRLGRILGRKGLMPNPKAGTVALQEQLPRVISESRKGRVEFRLDRTAIIHVPIGKASFDEESLYQNLAAMVEAVVKTRPAGAKGQIFRSIFLTTTMGPGIKLDLYPTLSLKAE